MKFEINRASIFNRGLSDKCVDPNVPGAYKETLIPYALLSKSARYRTVIAFQFALAVLSGARIMMIDEGDILDPPNRANLIDFLLAVRQDFDIILVFATSDHADPSPIPELAVWWLQDGMVSPVISDQGSGVRG